MNTQPKAGGPLLLSNFDQHCLLQGSFSNNGPIVFPKPLLFLKERYVYLLANMLRQRVAASPK